MSAHAQLLSGETQDREVREFSVWVILCGVKFSFFFHFEVENSSTFFARRPNSDKIQTLSLCICCSPIEDFSSTGLALWLWNMEDHKDRWKKTEHFPMPMLKKDTED